MPSRKIFALRLKHQVPFPELRTPVKDSWVSFIPFDLPGDLDHPGDLAKDKEAFTEELGVQDSCRG